MTAGADVIIVGGGPAGSSTAWHLARAGARVTVVDRAGFPRAKPCSEYLSPEASRLLDAMGVLVACERAGAAELAGMAIRAPDGARAVGRFDGAHGFHGYRDRGLALRRTVLDGILLDAARGAGARVAEGTQVTDLLRGPHGEITGVRTLDDRGAAAEMRATLVVGADGLRSVVARRLGLARTAAHPRRLAFVSHWRGVRGMGALGEMHVERDGYCGLARVDDGLTNVAVVVPVEDARAAKGRAADFLASWIAARPHLAPRFAGAQPVDDVMVTGPFAQRARRAWAPGAALVGDAADFYDPFTGEGIFAALRGGELLAPFALAALGASREREARAAMAAYDRARRAAFGGKWRLERLVALAVGSPVLMGRAARALAARPELADLLVGVTGDFVPPREVLSLSYVSRLLWFAARPVPAPAVP
ncbi:MAG TPA: NAD(P)/FAD-dependent oxidoreductase [Gemmatimonadaceae bacterium]|nr:NAD(P)/FAD-dependent oxidoreductase [Gemmatimonadaceae bacterium]